VTAPAWLPGSTETAYALAKVTGAIAMSLAAVPVWFLARWICGPWWGLVAAGLTLLVPTYALSGALMLETVALPLFLLAALAIVRALEQPTAGRQALALGAIALAAAARFQGVLLLPILATAVLALAAVEGRSVRPWLPSLGGVAALAAAWAGFRVAQDDSLVPTLGVYEGHASASYEVGEVLRWAAANAGALVLATGVVPALAFVLLAVGRRRPRETETQGALTAYLAVTAASVAWLVGLAAFAAAWEPAGLKERYLFYAEPLLLVALPVWLAHGLPRARLVASASALVAVALVATLPLERILDARSFLGNAYGVFLLDELGGADIALLVATLSAAFAGAILVLAPAGWLRVGLPAAVAVALAAGSWLATDRVLERARGADSLAGLERPQFVDEALGDDARVVYLNATAFQPAESAYDEWVPYWLAELWNRSLRSTVGLGLREPAPIAQRTASLDWGTGRVPVDPEPRHVLTERRFRIVGEELASDGRFVLTRVTPPLRFATITENVDADGVGRGASFDVFDESIGYVTVTVESPEATAVNVQAGELDPEGNQPHFGALTAVADGRAEPGRPARVRIQVLRHPGRVDVRLSAGTARISFEPER
jgi:hypothetical protein